METEQQESLREVKQKLDEAVAVINTLSGEEGYKYEDTKEYKELVYEERKQLEGLFQDRINFSLLFTSILLLATYRI